MILENQKQITAPRSIVWNVSVDVERWPQWAPTVEMVTRLDDGQFGVGSVALIKQPGLPEAQWRVTALSQGEGFTWETRIRGMRMVASHTSIPSGTGTSNLLRIEFSGWVALLLWPLIWVSVGKALEQENAGLKAKCEALTTSAT